MTRTLISAHDERMLHEEMGRKLDRELEWLRDIAEKKISPAARVKAAKALRGASVANHPFKIVQIAGELIIPYERSRGFREIYLDGREHPPRPGSFLVGPFHRQMGWGHTCCRLRRL